MMQKERLLDAPIPGMSLTHELGARPWQQPARLTTVTEVSEHYLERMMLPAFNNSLIPVMEMGIPLTTVANTLQLAGVMDGTHSVDTGLLVLPVIIETLILLGDEAGIKYNTGLEDDVELTQSDSIGTGIAEKLIRNKDKINMDEQSEIVVDDIKPEEEPTGLMARRN